MLKSEPSEAYLGKTLISRLHDQGVSKGGGLTSQCIGPDGQAQMRLSEKGAAMVEYALLVALIGVTIIGVLLGAATAMDGLFTRAGNEIATSGGFE